MGVDITASLLETALGDAGFWSSTPCAEAQGQQHASMQQLRLAYSAAVVRYDCGTHMLHPTTRTTAPLSPASRRWSMPAGDALDIRRLVNGVADSQQKGRLALSVNLLAESAGA